MIYKNVFMKEGVNFSVIYVLLNWKEFHLKNYTKHDFLKYFDQSLVGT